MSVDFKRGFASDNNAGVHPTILDELRMVNDGHVTGYGSDRYTECALEVFRENIGPATETFFVFTGTAANVLGISGVTRSWNSVIAASTAHLQTDECGAPEKFAGCKILPVDTPDGKITPSLAERHMHGFDFEHHAQPKVISITQSTEMGTVYSLEEIKKISHFAHSRGLLLHMDGARIANAAVSLGLPFKSFTSEAGVDVLSFGGTKNGMMFGEAICFIRPELSANFKYIRKQGMQLASKMRFISAQYLAYFRNGLWNELATHANRMAKLLESELRQVDGVTVTQKVESNGIFVILPAIVAERVRKQFFFYPWNEQISEYRFMTSWDTREEDIKDLVTTIRAELSRAI